MTPLTTLPFSSFSPFSFLFFEGMKQFLLLFPFLTYNKTGIIKNSSRIPTITITSNSESIDPQEWIYIYIYDILYL